MWERDNIPFPRKIKRIMQVKIAILGYGKRGSIYARYAQNNPDKFKVTAVAEIDPVKREIASNLHGCPVFEDWREMLNSNLQADIIAVATQDADHPEHAVACMERGFDILLEKPIATTEEGCEQILSVAKKHSRRVIVCHVLRYTPFYTRVKQIIDSGELGDILALYTSENVGYYHQAHSFVRGPWGSKEKSSPMILAKCCHDMDLLSWLIGKKCQKVASFGALTYFKEENAPENSANYCSDCKADCIYKAQNLYKKHRWMAGYFSQEEEWSKVKKALRHSQYDKCVFRSDNDVVDHQACIFNFEGGIIASHTMDAFSDKIYRDIKVHGTKAELFGIMEQNLLEIRPFGGKVRRIKIDTSKAIGGHGGGDAGIMEELYNEYNGLPTECITHIDVSIESHRMAFAAEKARETESVVVLK